MRPLPVLITLLLFIAPGCGDTAPVSGDTDGADAAAAELPPLLPDVKRWQDSVDSGRDSPGCLEDCVGVCGDGVCTVGENSCSCLADCPVVCGDGCCTPNELQSGCPQDCPAQPADAAFLDIEDVLSSPDDTVDIPVDCGNGTCDPGESAADCPADCDEPPDDCGNAVCDAGETVASCPADCKPPPDLSKGLAWVRDNPVFVSGLAVSTGPPSAVAAAEYYDEWHANATHLWANGCPGEVNGWAATGQPGFRWVSWLMNDGTSAAGGQVAGGFGANPPGRIGYQIGDEPGLDGDGMADLLEIQQGVDAVRAVDPDALIIVNFSWWAEGLDQMIKYYAQDIDGDIISYDLYQLSYSAHKKLAYFRAAGLQWNKPYWRYIKSYADVGKDDFPTASDMRWDAFIGLVYGYTGHSWFVYQAAAPHAVASPFFVAQGSLDTPKTPLWAQVGQINSELRHLGKAVTQLTSTDVRYIPGQALYSPEGASKWTQGAGGDPYITGIEAVGGSLLNIRDLAAGFFEDDAGEIYVMIQNQHHQGADWPIDNTDAFDIRVDFDFSGAPPSLDPGKVLTLSKDTGTVQDLPLAAAGPNKAYLQVNLAAADPILFKYATGATFALGPP